MLPQIKEDGFSHVAISNTHCLYIQIKLHLTAVFENGILLHYVFFLKIKKGKISFCPNIELKYLVMKTMKGKKFKNCLLC